MIDIELLEDMLKYHTHTEQIVELLEDMLKYHTLGLVSVEPTIALFLFTVWCTACASFPDCHAFVD